MDVELHGVYDVYAVVAVLRSDSSHGRDKVVSPSQPSQPASRSRKWKIENGE